MKVNQFIVKCISDSVDGLTRGKIYNILVIKKRNDELLSYFLKDDYGIYTEYRSDRFEIVDCYVEV